MEPERIASYNEFWPHYLREHAKSETRACHFLGTSLALLALVGFAASRKPWLVPAAAVAGYGPAWIGHFLYEKNRPATFQYFRWSLLSDLRMYATWLTGRLPAELARAGVRPNSP